jgi:ubiquinone/menaquinone biosynthesis C-methylase UbiE
MSKWERAMKNLIDRRKLRSATGTHPPINKVSDCKTHLSKVSVGRKVLDVGCGSMSIKAMLPKGTEYTGIDAFPYNDQVTHMEIEYCAFKDREFDTVICFAVLDGVRDIDRALFHIKRVCSKNIVILTGIDIEPDEFHTFKITKKYLDEQFAGWAENYVEWLNERVVLLEYANPELLHP